MYIGFVGMFRTHDFNGKLRICEILLVIFMLLWTYYWTVLQESTSAGFLNRDLYQEVGNQTESRQQDHLHLVCSNGTNDKQGSKASLGPDIFTDKYIAPDQINENEISQIPKWSFINTKFPDVKHGGRFSPVDKSNPNRIVIIVPYRDRRVHLKIFLNYMHAFLQRQNASYVIYVIEMESAGLFRKTNLINAGYLEVEKRENSSCLVIHDVDMLPFDETNIYRCDNSIRHFVSERHSAQLVNFTVSKRSQKFDKTGDLYFGGVIAYPTHYFRQLNGYSNLYSGWGGEDDDMIYRVLSKKMPLTKERSSRGRYYVLSHRRQPDFQNREWLVKSAADRMDKDGLSSVRYELKVVEERVLFTWILIQTRTPSCVFPGFVEKYKNQTHKGYTFLMP